MGLKRNFGVNLLGSRVCTDFEAGLVLDSFEETPCSAWAPWPELMERTVDGRYRLREDPDRLALQYVLTAHWPG